MEIAAVADAGAGAPWDEPGGWPLPLEAFSEHSAESEGMIGPIALWSGLGCYLLNALAQPKHDACPHPLGRLGCWFLTQLLFQASLEPLGVGFLVFGCGWVQEYGAKSSQLPFDSSSRSSILAYWHLPRPVIGATDTACTKFAARLPFQPDNENQVARDGSAPVLLKQRHRRPCGGNALNDDCMSVSNRGKARGSNSTERTQCFQ
jgi:hypothetical protein